MKKMFMMIAVLALCANSFGEILVYKVSANTSGFTVGPSWGPQTATVFKGGLKGYVVADVVIQSLNSASSPDANFLPALIITADKSFVKLALTEPNVINASFDLTQPFPDKYNLKFDVIKKNGKITKRAIVIPQFNFHYLTSNPVLDVQFSDNFVTGDLDLVTLTIGVPRKVALPRTIRGETFFGVTTDFGGFQNSTGNATFRFDSKFTESTNNQTIPLNVTQAAAIIEDDLIKHGYKPKTPQQFFANQ